MREKCLVKEYNTMLLATARTQTARSRDDSANHGICGRRGGLMVSALDSGVTTWQLLRSEWSGFEPWPGTLCYVLGQDTVYS